MTPAEPLDLSFPTALAPPGHVVDWRIAVVFRHAWETGVWDGLPGTAETIASGTGLDPAAVRAVLDVLAVWGVVAAGADGAVHRGPHAPADDDAAALVQHGVWIQRWSSMLGERLKDRLAPPPPTVRPPGTAEGLRLLAAASRRSIGPVVDVCLRAVPHARRALDLGGGHGEYALEFARRGLSVVLQDLPGVIALVKADPRFDDVELVAADLFESVAAGPFDLVLCSTVTTMFNASDNRPIAERLRSAVGYGGAAVVSTYMRDRSAVGAFFGVQMLVATDGGGAHSSADHGRWLAEAGFDHIEVEDLSSPPLSLVIARVGCGTTANRAYPSLGVQGDDPDNPGDSPEQ